MALSLFEQNEKRIKETTSKCPECLAECPAEVWQVGEDPGRIEMRRTCPAHGERSFTIAGDARFYYYALGERSDGCAGGACCSADGSKRATLGTNAAGAAEDRFETLASCVTLIEIVYSCNLPCSACFASSELGTGAHVHEEPLEVLKERIESVIERKGGIEVLQLTGGEPTLHTRFFELLDWALEHPRIDGVLINTNGLRIARDDAFCARLMESLERGYMRLYLQYDGSQEAGQKRLRGSDTRHIKRRAIERARDIGLSVHLAMTVVEENLAHLWETIEFGLAYENVRGVTFQPMFYSGRIPEDAKIGDRPITAADVAVGLIDQSSGTMSAESFTPLPCGDPNCHLVSALLRLPTGVQPISDFFDLERLQDFLKDKISYNLEDLARCGCEDQELAEVLKRFGLTPSTGFLVVVKPFMDARTWDKDRTDRCCTHVIRPGDGALVSFCQYYAS